jgi:hypothetical protein
MAFASLPPSLDTRLWVQVPVIVLHPPYTKVAISLPELVRQTNAFSVKRRAGCQPTLKRSRPKELYLEYNVVCHESYSDPRGHDVQVQFDLSQVEETQDAKRLDVRVSCSCPAFLYWGAQWNLHRRDGLHGQPRPLLQAPTQRLDLRGNFVICKHVKAVFERILPAVQHNITKVVREREVKRTKERMVKEERPTEKEKRLRREQMEMRMKKDINRILRTKDPDERERLIKELVEKEKKRLYKQIETEQGEGPKKKPPAAPAPAPPPAPARPPEEKKKVVRRDEPATAPPKPPEPAPAPKEEPGLKDLVREEERKLREKKEGPESTKVRLPEGWWKRLLRKRTSLETSLLGALALKIVEMPLGDTRGAK